MKTLMETNEFRDKLFEGKLTRRQAHKVLASFGIGFGMMPLMRGAQAAAEDQPVFFTWGGYDDPAFTENYRKKHGGDPVYSLYASEEEAFSKMRAGYTPDMTFPCYGSVPRWYDGGLLTPIDKGMLSNWDDMIEPLKNLPEMYVNGELVFVPEDWGQNSVMFRADLAPEYKDNHTWGILWDPKYAGRLAVTDGLQDNMPMYMIYAGIETFDMNDAEVAKVRAVMVEQMPLLRMMVSDMTSIAQALVSGEVVASFAWQSLIWRVQEYATEAGLEGAEFVWMKPKEGPITWVCGLSIHPHAHESGMYEKCHDVIDSYISPEAGYYELTEWNYGVVNSKVYQREDITEEFLKGIGLSKDIESLLAGGLFQEPFKNEAALAVMFEEVKAEFAM